MTDEKSVVLFKDNEFELEVTVSPKEDTVWLTQKQIATLFNKDRSTITKHINNIFMEEEVDEKSSVGFSNTANSDKPVKVYNLDIIISVGYRVKSKRGVTFRKWANSILKKYLLKGYVINQEKLNIPNYDQVIDMLENYRHFENELTISSNELLDFLIAYKKGLNILDNYDHQTLEVIRGEKDTYKIGYDECIEIIHQTSFKDKNFYFAVEHDDSFKSSIAAIYQTFNGKELYPTLEEKSSNLLYLVTKNHSFVDGNKRIAAIIFLYFLEKNNALQINGMQRISNETLATLTILVASSNPNEKRNIINLIQLLIS